MDYEVGESLLSGLVGLLRPAKEDIIQKPDLLDGMVYVLSDSFTILGLWVLGLPFSRINESNCKLMSPEHYFNDKSAILLHPGTR